MSEIRRLQDFNRDLRGESQDRFETSTITEGRPQFKANVPIFKQISENLENARTHVAKEVEAADHNQHIMAKLLEQSKYAVFVICHIPLPGFVLHPLL